MVVTVIGIERKHGEFITPHGEKIGYDNMHYYCQYVPDESQNADIVGVRTVDYKIKTDRATDAIDIGDRVEVFFNQYRTPEVIVVVEKGDAK